MNSIALYSKSKNSNDSGSQSKKNVVELHINLWKTKNGLINVKPNLILDFGIKFDSIINELCLFLPFQISKSNGVKDLGKCLSTNRDLLNAVFNEDLVCQSATNHCFSRIENTSRNNDKDRFYIYYLGNENFDVKDYKEGIQLKGNYITIKINGSPSDTDNSANEKYYIRFRVCVENVNEIVCTELLSNDLLQAAFSRTDLFDIRLNEKREIPSKVEEKMKKKKFEICSFSKLHFFYIVDTREIINNGVDVRKDSRLLENNQWIDYEPQSNIANVNYVAHHWKKNAENDNFSHFSLFFSTIYPKISFLRLLAYLSVVILLGWVGSMLSFCLYDLHDSGWKIIFVLLMFVYVIFFLVFSNFIFKMPGLQRKL